MKTLHQLSLAPLKDDIKSRIAICGLERELVSMIVESQDKSIDEVVTNL